MEQANIHTCILQEQEQQLMAQHAAIDIRFKQIKLSTIKSSPLIFPLHIGVKEREN